MHIWTIEKWKKFYSLNEKKHRIGLRLKFENDVNLEVKEALKNFANWLRKEYYFPIRIPVYVKSKKRIQAKDGDLVCGTFFWPSDKKVEPYIRIATGDYDELKIKRGRDDALASILMSMAHELTHYFQWVNDLQLTEIGEERQATKYSHYILDEYAETREHP